MKNVFLVNSYACRGKIDELVMLINEKTGGDCEIYLSQKEGDITEKAKTLHGCTVFSLGGDGTFREAVNGVADTDNIVCAVQIGSGNDFVRSLGEKRDLETILSGLENYSERKIDVGTVNGEYFANITSVGYDAEVVKNAEKFKKTPLLRRFSYILSVFYTLFTFKGLSVSAEIDGEKFDGKVLLIACANGQYYGGGIRIAPTAVLDDGLLDVYLVDNISMFRLLTFLPRLLNGSHINIKYVHRFLAKKVTITSDEDFILNIDGDLFPRRSAEIGIVPGGLKILSASDKKGTDQSQIRP